MHAERGTVTHLNFLPGLIVTMCFMTLVVAVQPHTTQEVRDGIITSQTAMLHGDLSNKAIPCIEVVIVIITRLDQMIYDYAGTPGHRTVVTIDAAKAK